MIIICYYVLLHAVSSLVGQRRYAKIFAPASDSARIYPLPRNVWERDYAVSIKYQPKQWTKLRRPCDTADITDQISAHQF